MGDWIKGGTQKEVYAAEDVVTRDCPLCSGKEYKRIYRERGEIGIVKCAYCGLIYVNPMPKDPEQNYWGDEERYYEEARLIFTGRKKHHRDKNYIEDINNIKKLKPAGNFLDIGTNMGFFLRNAKGRGWNVYGVEPSPSLSEMARRYFGLNVKTAYLADAGFEEEFFDVVTMTDVFEHISEPKEMLMQIKRIIKKDGILYIKVPNGAYNLLKLGLAKVTGKTQNYDIFDSYEHISHYTYKTLKKMLDECGFKVRKTLIGSPIHPPAWHKYVGHYYQYPSPPSLDIKNFILRNMFYWISKIEFLLRGKKTGYFASNIIMAASPE